MECDLQRRNYEENGCMCDDKIATYPINIAGVAPIPLFVSYES